MDCKNKIITIVRGNKVTVALPLEQILVTEDNKVVEDFVPLPTDKIVVNLKDRKVYSYTPTIEGNVARFTLGADVACGVYGIEVLVTREDGTYLRSYRLRQLSIVENNEQAGILPESVEFDYDVVTLDNAVFLFAKGDKGDAGVSIVSVECVAPSTQSGGQNVILVTLSDGTTSQFIVRNGEKGDKGDTFTYEDLTEEEKTDIAAHVDLAGYVNGGEYNSLTKEILLKHNSTVVSRIDATEFIKDGMVESVVIENGEMIITFNTDAGQEDIHIDLTDIFNPANYYTKTEINDKLPLVIHLYYENSTYSLGDGESVTGAAMQWQRGRQEYIFFNNDYYPISNATIVRDTATVTATIVEGGTTTVIFLKGTPTPSASGFVEQLTVTITTGTFANEHGDSSTDFAANNLTADTLNADAIYFAGENMYDLLDSKVDVVDMAQYAKRNTDVAFGEVSSTKLSGTDGAVEMVVPTYANAEINGIQISKGEQVRTTIPLNRVGQTVAMMGDLEDKANVSQLPQKVNVTMNDDTLVAETSAEEVTQWWGLGNKVYYRYDDEDYLVYKATRSGTGLMRTYAVMATCTTEDAVKIMRVFKIGTTAERITVETIGLGGGIFLVTITEEQGSYVADKTFAEAMAAYNNGSAVCFRYDGVDVPAYLFGGSLLIAEFMFGSTSVSASYSSEGIDISNVPLVAEDNLKTINNTSLLGSGDLALATAEALSNYCPIIEDTRSSAVAAITGVAPFSQLVDGQRIVLRLKHSTANNATLNLTLADSTTTGEIPLYYRRWNNFVDKISQSYGQYLAGQYVEMFYTASTDRWVCVSDHDTNTTYGTITQAEIDAGTQTGNRVISPKLLRDNFALLPTLVEVQTTGDVTQALDSGKFYRFGEVDSLTITLTAASAGMGIYGGKFTASANWSALALPATIDEAAGNDTIAAGKTYEFNVLDNVIVLKEV